MIIEPKYFVNLHTHSNASIGDALGLPKELWNLSNGRILCINCHRTTITHGKRITDVN
jgi:hypothetical protein